MRCISSPILKAPQAVPVSRLWGVCWELLRRARCCVCFHKGPGSPCLRCLILSVLKGWRRMQGFLKIGKSWHFVFNLLFSVNSVRCSEKTPNYSLSCYPGSKTAQEKGSLFRNLRVYICVLWAFGFSYEIIINCAWRWNTEDDAALWNWI